MIRGPAASRIALVALAAALPAAAQDKPQPSPSPSPSPEAPRYRESVEVEGRLTVPAEATTATKLAVPIEKLPLSISAVSSGVLQAQDGRTLIDALPNTPGVNIATGFGTFDYFTIRGFDSLSSSLILVDGALEPESTYYQMYNVRRVEVLRGPGAYLYGGNPLSGTVNVIRKQPGPGRFADVLLSGGSYANYDGRFDGNYAQADGKGQYRLNAMYQQADNYRDDKKNDVTGINPAATWRLGGRGSLTASYEYVKSSYQPDVGLPIVGGVVPAVPRTRSYQSPFDFSDQTSNRGRIDFQTGLGEHGTLRDKLYFTQLKWQSDGTLFLGAFPAAAGDFALLRTLTQLDDDQRFFGNQLEASWNAKTGSLKHTLLLGIEASHLKDAFTFDVALLPAIGVYNPVETAQRPLFNIPGQSLAVDGRTNVFAPYLVDQVAFTDQVQLTLAGRYDALDYEDKKMGTKRSEDQWSPMLGLLIAPSPKLSLYGNFGKAFAPPSTLVVGPRDPEKTTQYEAGAKSRLFGGRALVTVAVFQIEKLNVAIPDNTGVTRQQGSEKSRGFEAEVQAELVRDWHVQAAYAWTDAKLTEFRQLVQVSQTSFVVLDRAGNFVPFAPRNLFNFWTQRDWKNGLSLGAGARYVCTQFIDEDNAFKIPEHWTFDATVAYKLKSAQFRVNFKNVLGEEYYARGFSNTSVIPANPFAVYGTLQFTVGSHQ
jgi:catecholate siderophore receptor